MDGLEAVFLNREEIGNALLVESFDGLIVLDVLFHVLSVMLCFDLLGVGINGDLSNLIFVLAIRAPIAILLLLGVLAGEVARLSVRSRGGADWAILGD